MTVLQTTCTVSVFFLSTEVCHALNVTVTPGPVSTVTEKDNLTLSCLVSQRKRSSSVLILRWFFSPLAFLIAKMGITKTKLYGNYTRRFPQPKFHLYEETESEVYRLWILNVTGTDQGFYTCRVQEIRKHQKTWKALSNGTSTTQLTVVKGPIKGSEDAEQIILCLHFVDVYLYAVLICSLGLLSIFLFTLVVTCQYFHRRQSSGETVTSSSSSSSSSPKAQRKDLRQKTDRRVTATPPKLPEDPPPHIPAKGKPQASREDSLTYAELELVRPRPDPPTSSSLDPTPSNSDTVYAQILFQEKQL
uniref:V-set and transmembrane domain containing 4a n=1 Tax=Mastacembelus armatus TaxID=205130 RepID=A0A3Q3L966_9TELE